MEISPLDGGAPIGQGANTAASGGPTSSATNHDTDAATTDPSDDPNIGGRQEGALEKAVAPIRPRLRACYKKALAAEPGIGGTAVFDATIAKDGRASSARFVKRDGLNDDMVGCLLAAVKAMTFETDKKSQIVAFTFGTPKAEASPSSSPPTSGLSDAGTKR